MSNLSIIAEMIGDHKYHEAREFLIDHPLVRMEKSSITPFIVRHLNWWHHNWDRPMAGAHKRGQYRDLINLAEAFGVETPDTFPDGSLILEVAGRREATASGECWGILIKAKGTRSKAVAQHILRRLKDQFDAGRFDRPGTEYELELHDCCEHSLHQCERKE